MERMKFGVSSETGKLKSVLMSRPGDEILKVTKETMSYYGFRDIPKLSKMQEEFDDFTTILKENNVEVVFLDKLLEETKHPNQLFTRDYIGVSTKGLIVMNMAVESRREEPKIAKEALKKLIPVHVEIKTPQHLEGGDLVYIDEGILAIGYGPRSNYEGVTKLISKLRKTSVNEIIIIPLPAFRVHLDGAFMIVDHGICVIHEPSLTYQPVQIITKKSTRTEPLLDYLRLKGYSTLAVTDEETKSFGSNIFTIRSGKVIAYEWNTDIIKRLEKKGIDVMSIKGKELVKGGGGPHCLTSPILRDP